MKGDLNGKLVLDASALIELVYSTPVGLKLREAMKNDAVEASATEIGITELTYILCRRLGLTESRERVNMLLASGYVIVEDTASLIDDTAKYKCERPFSLADCFTLALAHKAKCRALFAKRESELVQELERRPLDTEILFLEDYG